MAVVGSGRAPAHGQFAVVGVVWRVQRLAGGNPQRQRGRPALREPLGDWGAGRADDGRSVGGHRDGAGEPKGGSLTSARIDPQRLPRSLGFAGSGGARPATGSTSGLDPASASYTVPPPVRKKRVEYGVALCEDACISQASGPSGVRLRHAHEAGGQGARPGLATQQVAGARLLLLRARGHGTAQR